MSNDMITNSVFDFAYGGAMRDAVLRGAYNGERKGLVNNQDAKKKVRKFADRVLAGEFSSQEDYDLAFYDTAEHIPLPNFTFGNGQKLVNMTLKYLYIGCYYNSNMRNVFAFCHCPMDGIMLKKAWDKRTLLSDITLGTYNYFLKGWGADIDTARYKKFQKAIRFLAAEDGVTALEYDFLHWDE